MLARQLLNSVSRNRKPNLPTSRSRSNKGNTTIKSGTDNTKLNVQVFKMGSNSMKKPIIKQPKISQMSQEKEKTTQKIEQMIFSPKKGIGHWPVANNDNNVLAEIKTSFELAVKQLNTLQTNQEALRRSVQTQSSNIDDTIKYMERSGLTFDDLRQLSFIHVAGTKGKGTTCALTECILRQFGLHTGFYSSPHIMKVTERIRINGEPLEKLKFTRHFWQVYNRLMQKRTDETDMPAYFKFLTILAFHIFLEERVDVVVMEVGIGGEFDCTNVVPDVGTVGITSLGLEHTELLGKTLEEIAWQKAGIIKAKSRVYTHVDQPECLSVIRARADLKQATVYEVPPFHWYFRYNLTPNYINTFNDVICLNGSLAIQLAYDWIRHAKPKYKDYFLPNEARMCGEVLLGLRNVNWPARCQIVEFSDMRLHFDGAHTVESMRVCNEFFLKSTSNSTAPKILIFNRIGESDPVRLLLVLFKCCQFDLICFTPNVASDVGNDLSQVALRANVETQVKRVQEIAICWSEMCRINHLSNNSKVFYNVYDVFKTIRKRYCGGKKPEVLITGSIHLIGAAITALKKFE